MNEEQRKRFLFCYGNFYAGLGGLFAAYRTADEAFEKAKEFKPYEALELGSKPEDFNNFREGFSEFQKLRIKMLLAKRDAENEMKLILNSIRFEAPNYLYAGGKKK